MDPSIDPHHRIAALERRQEGLAALMSRDFLRVKADVCALQNHTGCSPVKGDGPRGAILPASSTTTDEADRWMSTTCPSDTAWRQYLDRRFAEVEARLERMLVNKSTNQSIITNAMSCQWYLDVPLRTSASRIPNNDSYRSGSLIKEKSEDLVCGDLKSTLQAVVNSFEKDWVEQLNRINQMAPSLATEAYEAAVQEMDEAMRPVQQQLDTLKQRCELQTKQMQRVLSRHEELQSDVDSLYLLSKGEGRTSVGKELAKLGDVDSFSMAPTRDPSMALSPTRDQRGTSVERLQIQDESSSWQSSETKVPDWGSPLGKTQEAGCPAPAIPNLGFTIGNPQPTKPRPAASWSTEPASQPSTAQGQQPSPLLSSQTPQSSPLLSSRSSLAMSSSQPQSYPLLSSRNALQPQSSPLLSSRSSLHSQSARSVVPPSPPKPASRNTISPLSNLNRLLDQKKSLAAPLEKVPSKETVPPPKRMPSPPGSPRTRARPEAVRPSLSSRASEALQPDAPKYSYNQIREGLKSVAPGAGLPPQQSQVASTSPRGKVITSPRAPIPPRAAAFEAGVRAPRGTQIQSAAYERWKAMRCDVTEA